MGCEYPHVGYSTPLMSEERILLCSDGLTDMVNENEVLHALDDISDLSECVIRLFKLAMLGGGYDNISIVIARCL
jgi:serine/threonine protein phosphatase PrpC